MKPSISTRLSSSSSFSLTHSPLTTLLLVLFVFISSSSSNLIVRMENYEKFVQVGSVVVSFDIKLDVEACRKFIKSAVILRDSTAVDPHDYFAVKISGDKKTARMTVIKTPDPDAIDYFRKFVAQVRIDFDTSNSDQKCEPSIGGIQMTILDSNDNSPVFDESTKILRVDENLAQSLQLAVKANDADYDKTSNGRVTFALADVTPKKYEGVVTMDSLGRVTIDPAKSAERLFDRETDPKVFLRIEANDNPTEDVTDATYGKHVVTENIVLEIVDANDNPPTDCRLKSACEVKEDHPVKGTLSDCLVVCEDADATPVFK